MENRVEGQARIGTLIQAHAVTIGQLPATQVLEGWARLVVNSPVWHLVPAGRETEAYRQLAGRVASQLADLGAQSEAVLTEDPWRDPDFATRFVHQVGRLVGESAQGEPLGLYPAEAALLVLLPLVHQVQRLRVAAAHVAVDPADLVAGSGVDGARAAFQSYVSRHERLASRARLRPQAAPGIGWWLFHRWVGAEIPVTVTDLELDLEFLVEIAETGSVHRLLDSLRRGPSVCDPEHLSALRELTSRGPEGQHQRVREQRLALILALGYGLALEMTALPDTVVEHLGIPHPVHLDELRVTLEGAQWGGPAELPVLEARCHHEAVIEALREYTGRVDELLHAVHRAVVERVKHPMPVLPVRLSADRVAAVEESVRGWAKFRSDERRVRELLMGTQLYKDQGLAVRELYQNALDACRYRRARTEFLQRKRKPYLPFEGEIAFVQGVEEETGRAYLECRDNGVGMGEAELRGVFSNAGSRFAEHPDFLLEQAEWEKLDPPVKLYPNSRFGIGVLSYFMLADEIRVTSCRMDRAGQMGPVVEAAIFGPGHLFRIVELGEEWDEPGTRVRLYLREEVVAGEFSCVDALDRVLRIAEFATSAHTRLKRKEWPAGELQRSDSIPGNPNGRFLAWPDGPPGIQVIWCERGGGILVDGLLVRPSRLRGVVQGSTGLLGVVINLSGEFAPRSLSVDRREVLDDVSEVIEEHLTAAVCDLMVSPDGFVIWDWLDRISMDHPRLADLVVRAAMAAGLSISPGRGLQGPELGFFHSDRELHRGMALAWERSAARFGRPVWGMPDSVLLWRLLAIGPSALLASLAEVVPELAMVTEVAPALPSDYLVLAEALRRVHEWHEWPTSYALDDQQVDLRRVHALSERLCADPRAASHRLVRLYGYEIEPSGLPDRRAALEALLHALGRRCPEPAISVTDLLRARDRTDLALPDLAAWAQSCGFPLAVEPAVLSRLDETDELILSEGEGAATGNWLANEPVRPGQVANIAFLTRLTTGEVQARLRLFGMVVEEALLPEIMNSEVIEWLGCPDFDYLGKWLSSRQVLPIVQVRAASQRFGVSYQEACRRYEALGFATLPEPPVEDIRAAWQVFQRGSADRSPAGFGAAGRGVPYVELIAGSFYSDIELGRAVEVLRACGIVIHLSPPGEFALLDEDLLSFDEDADNEDQWWGGLKTDDTVPFFRLIPTANLLGRHPAELAERLASYGVPVSHPDLPAGLDHRTALRLLREDSRAGDLPTPADAPLRLEHLIRLADRIDSPLLQTAAWLRDMGVHVPDVADTIRAALARVPRKEA